MKDLEFYAMMFLRFEKSCPVALTERSPRPHHGRPDVLGITKDRYLLEIEVKRSLLDFRANNKKPHIANRFNLVGETCADFWPRSYWYLVPFELVEKVKPLIPEWAGLLRGPDEDEARGVFSVIKAPPNKASKRLTTKECARLAHCMANQIYGQAIKIRHLLNDTRWHIEPDYEI